MAKITTNPTVDYSTDQPAKLYYLDDSVAILPCIGSPEGVITADAGSIASDVNNGNVYSKTTNGVNTGWTLIGSGGGGGSPGAPNLSLQYNNGGAFGGIPTAFYNVGGSGRTSFDLDKFQLGSGLGGSIVDDAGFRLLSFGGSGGTPKVSYFTISNTATGGTPSIVVTSTDANCGFTITSVGNGIILLNGGPTRIAPTARNNPSGAAYYLRVTTPADTNLPTGIEASGMIFGGSSAAPPVTVTRQFATGAISKQRESLFTAPTYGFVGASTISEAYTVEINGAPVAGTNATLSEKAALSVIGGISSPNSFLTSQSFGLRAGASAQQSTALGYNANASNDGAISIGYNTSNWTNCICLGTSSNVQAGLNNSIAIGTQASCSSAADSSIAMGLLASCTQANTAVIGSNSMPIANIFFARGQTSTTPTAFSINGTGGNGTDIQGAGFNLTAGLGTGTGNPGTIGIRFARPSSTGSSPNIQSDEFIFGYTGLNTLKQDFQIQTSTTQNVSAGLVGIYWNNATHATRGSVYQVETVSNATTSNRALIVSRKNLTDAATNLFEVALPTLTGFSCVVSYEIFATNGTDVQVRSGLVRLASVNKAGAYTSDNVIMSEGIAASTGTLTATFAITGGANKVTISVTPAGSLAETVYYITYTIENNSEQVITIL